MNRDRIEKLKEIVPASEQVELTVFYNAYVKTLREYQDDPDNSPDRLKANRAASAALVELVEGLENKYLTGAIQFRSVMDALRFLKGDGWKIEKSKLYKDRDAGLFRVNADKSVDEVEILAYAARHLSKERVTGSGDEAGKLSESKLTSEVDLNKLRQQKLSFEIAKDKGQYIHRAKWLAELVGKLSAARFAALKIARDKAPDLIAAVGGDLRKESMFVELFSGYIEAAYNELATAPELHFAIKHGGDDGL